MSGKPSTFSTEAPCALKFIAGAATTASNAAARKMMSTPIKTLI